MILEKNKTIKEIRYALQNLIRAIYQKTWFVFHIFKLYSYIVDIPKDALYCYTPLEHHKDGSTTIKKCPFHTYLYGELCLLNGSDCLDDWCKTCGVNDYFDERIM